VLWLLTAPWCGWSALILYQRANDAQALPVRLETAVLVTQGGLVAMLAAWALYWGQERADAWDSMRLFFGVLAVVAFLAAPITAAVSWVRRLTVSALVVVHFLAILSAVLGMQPGPFLFSELQHWVFRSYLQFMYLNNGYRFYSPEPSPASQVWFRVEYRHEGRSLRVWVKLPDMDDNGKPHYLTGVQLTRHLALTENVARADEIDQVQSPLMVIVNGQAMPSDIAIQRDLHTPKPEFAKLGIKQPANPLGIPYHPELPRQQNYYKPDAAGRKLLSSYARYILAQPHPQNPNAVPYRVKVYRVLHRIITAQALARGADPHDPTFYLPYYVGEFDPDGKLKDADDAFLYWVLPIVRDGNGMVRFYVYKHAGDETEFMRPLDIGRPLLK
jgi:hypothetical protein